MSKSYVKYKTNIEWYHVKDLMYLTLYNCLVAFLPKLKEAPFPGHPVMGKKEAESVGAVYFEDKKELPVLEDFGGPPFSFGGTDASPIDDSTVFIEMVPTIERLIQECPADSEDPWDWDDWWAKANWIVPYLWD